MLLIEETGAVLTTFKLVLFSRKSVMDTKIENYHTVKRTWARRVPLTLNATSS